MKRTPSKSSAQFSMPVAARALRILCAEDNAQMAEVLHHFLVRAGHRPALVEDGQQALAQITDDPEAFDLLITDHQMPRLTGLGLVSKLRDTAFAGPIIVFSSMLSAAEVAAYHALAVDHILTKPTQIDTLLRVLHDTAMRIVPRSA